MPYRNRYKNIGWKKLVITVKNSRNDINITQKYIW